MWEKDRLNLENMLEAIQKIETYTTQFHEAAEEIWQIVQTHLRKLKTDIHQILGDLIQPVDTIPPSEG
jgi:uncharacterized protein with HEPN domain